MNVRLSKAEKIKIANSKDVYEVMQKILMRQNRLRRQKEYFWAIGLSSIMDINYIELIAIGTLDSILVDPIEIFNFAAIKKCKRIILVHNHPSGALKPSKEDKKITKDLQQGAKYLGIKIIDHLIINETAFFSFSDKGLIK